MTVVDTLQEIAGIFSGLSAGVPDERLYATYNQHLAKAFSQLALDLQAMSGWSAPIGVATRAAFDPATVTLPQLAERTKAIIDDHLARGDFGP